MNLGTERLRSRPRSKMVRSSEGGWKTNGEVNFSQETQL